MVRARKQKERGQGASRRTKWIPFISKLIFGLLCNLLYEPRITSAGTEEPFSILLLLLRYSKLSPMLSWVRCRIIAIVEEWLKEKSLSICARIVLEIAMQLTPCIPDDCRNRGAEACFFKISDKRWENTDENQDERQKETLCSPNPLNRCITIALPALWITTCKEPCDRSYTWILSVTSECYNVTT